MKRKYILLILTFLTTLLCSVGSSLWLVLEEEKVSPPLFEGIEIDIENEAQIPVPVLPDSLTSGYFTGDLDLTYEEGTGTEVETNGVDIPGSWSITEMDFTAKSTDKNKVSVDVEVTFTPTDYTDVYNPTTVTQTITVIAVAQYGSEYYATVDGALQAANAANSGTVYVLPLGYELDTGIAKEAKTIRKTTTINSGVTLALPYTGTTVLASTHNPNGVLHSPAFKTPETCLKNNVTLATNLTNNGYIQIGGLISGGSGGAPYSSFTAEQYSQLSLANGITLTNKKTGEGTSAGIQCYGQITEETKGGSVGIVCNGGTMISPFTIRDHRGGSAYFAVSGIKKSDLIGAVLGGLKSKPDITPFNKLYLPNITAPLKIENSGLLYGYANLWANDENQITTMNLIGNTNKFMIQLASGSYATADFDHETEITDLDIYGSASMNSMSLDLRVVYSGITANVSISTENALFPINWHFNVGLHKNGNTAATVNLIQHVRIMPGGSLTIDEGVTVTVSKLAVYDDTFVDPGGPAAASHTPYEQVYPETSSLSGTAVPSGKLVVNGTLNASSIGGLVETENTGATLNVSATSVNTKEVIAVTGSGLDAAATFKTITNNFSIYPYANGSVSSTAQTGTVGKYISKNGGWESQAVITVSLNLDGGSMSGSDKFPLEVAAGTTSISINLPNPSRSGYSFQGWSVTGGSLPNSKPNGSTTLTINAGVKSVSITATWKQNSCLVEGTLITLADGTQKKVEDITAQDDLLIFNHETGKYEVGRLWFNDHADDPAEFRNVINLVFSDGTVTRVAYEHGYFDLDLNKYIFIREETIQDYIGHRFYTANYTGTGFVGGEVTLVDAYITQEFVKVYGPLTEYHFNLVADGLLSMPSFNFDVRGFINIFEYGENLKYDEEKMLSDIEKYGLFTYEDFAEYMSYEDYCKTPIKYFKVSIAKGYLTYEEIELTLQYLYENGFAG